MPKSKIKLHRILKIKIYISEDFYLVLQKKKQKYIQYDSLKKNARASIPSESLSAKTIMLQLSKTTSIRFLVECQRIDCIQICNCCCDESLEWKPKNKRMNVFLIDELYLNFVIANMSVYVCENFSYYTKFKIFSIFFTCIKT